jgi:hypothetical protein
MPFIKEDKLSESEDDGIENELSATVNLKISNFTKLDSNYEAYVLNELVNIK